MVYGVLLHFHAFQGQGMPDNPQVQDWDKLCSKALKLCFDAMSDTALVFFGIFKVIILIALKKVFNCKCPELELSLKSSNLQLCKHSHTFHQGNHIMGMSPKFATYIETWILHQSYAFQVVFFGSKEILQCFFGVKK